MTSHRCPLVLPVIERTLTFMSFADVRGASLFYTDEGTGNPPMLFVHGFGCDSHDWSWQLPHFAPSHRVIAFDNRGFGRSSTPDDGYEVASLAADAAALIEQVSCGPVVGVGHLLSCAIGTALDVERPGRRGGGGAHARGL